MNKIDREKNILKRAHSLLYKLYGDFHIVSEQVDRPDAAILIKKSKIKIGIEITSIDPERAQEYINNEKISNEVCCQQLETLLNDGSYSTRPVKKLSIPFPPNYIFDGVVKKTNKYQSYLATKQYGEILVLAFSSHLNVDYATFNCYHKPWTNFLLSEQVFPFDKVIFVGERTGDAVVIYNKIFPLQEKPSVNCEKEAGITIAKGSIFPMGKTVNINSLFTEEPIVLPKKKPRRSHKNKDAP